MTRPLSAIVVRLILAGFLILPGQPAWSQQDPVLGDVTIATTPGCTTIRVAFDIPIAYLRHFPYESGETLLVFVWPLGRDPRNPDSQLPRETALIPPSKFTALRDIVLEGDAPGGPYLSIVFTHKLAYEVRQGRDYRSIVVYVPSPGASESCPPDR